MKIAPATYIPIDQLVPAKRNPNRMSEARFQALKRSIDEKGFLQPIIVRHLPEQGLSEIVDGHHRVRALRELGFGKEVGDAVPAVDATGFTEAEVELIRLSMSNRGELDLTIASEIIDDLLGEGLDFSDLELSGLELDELEALAGATKELDAEELLEESIRVVEEESPEGEPVTGLFVLELELNSARELKAARALLRKAGGKRNKDLAKGFRALAGWEKQ